MVEEHRTPGWIIFFAIIGVIVGPALLFAWLFDGSQASKQAVGAILGLGAVGAFVIVMGFTVYLAIRKAVGKNPGENGKSNP